MVLHRFSKNANVQLCIYFKVLHVCRVYHQGSLDEMCSDSSTFLLMPWSFTVEDCSGFWVSDFVSMHCYAIVVSLSYVLWPSDPWSYQFHQCTHLFIGIRHCTPHLWSDLQRLSLFTWHIWLRSVPKWYQWFAKPSDVRSDQHSWFVSRHRRNVRVSKIN